MFGGRRTKALTCTRISLGERLASCLILGLIGAVGVAVYLKGQSFDPGLFALDETRLAEIPESRVPTARLLATGDEGIAVDSGATAEPTGLLGGLVPAGWETLGSAEFFDADKLYEKINGRAELYLAHHVRGLTCLSLIEPEGQFIDIYVYEMGQPPDAFGIFSAQRAPGQPDEDLGRGGYRSESSFFFCTGSYYVQVLASDRTEPLRRVAAGIARLLDSRLGAADGEIQGRGDADRKAVARPRE